MWAGRATYIGDREHERVVTRPKWTRCEIIGNLRQRTIAPTQEQGCDRRSLETGSGKALKEQCEALRASNACQDGWQEVRSSSFRSP